MTDPAEGEVIGRWRIIEADQWDREYLDLVEPAFIRFDRDGSGDLAFGVVTASLHVDYARTVVFFTFDGSDEGDEVSGDGSDEGDEVSGDGSAELTEDGALEIELSTTTAMTPSSKPNESEFFNSLLAAGRTAPASPFGD